LGARGFIIPSAGNAGGAAAGYAAGWGVPCAGVVPRGTAPAGGGGAGVRGAGARRPPPAPAAEAASAGARVCTIEGSIATAGKVVAAVAPKIGWFDLSPLKETYRLESQKHAGPQLAHA